MKAYPHPPRRSVDFGKLMSGSMGLVWRHKYLWFFGLFAWGSSSLGGWNCNYQADSGSPGTTRQPSEFDREVSDWASSHVGLIVSLVILAAAAGIAIWLWSILCRGAVIGTVREIRAGAPTSFGSAFRRGRASFGKLLLFDLFMLLLFICLMVIVTAALLFMIFLAGIAGTPGVVLLSLIGLWILTFFGFGMGFLAICTIWFVPWVFLGILLNFAVRAVVLEGERPMAALRSGFGLMKANLTQTLLMFLISVGLSIGASIAMVIIVGVSSIPSVIAWAAAYGAGWPVSLIVAGSALALLPVAALLLAAALMNTYFTTYWTAGYDELSGNAPAPADGIMPAQPAPGAI
jgi:hypothetical protein